jgi:hypothetical protein
LRGMYATLPQRRGFGGLQEGARIRWYNPVVQDFEWREVPKSDEEALSLLEGSPYSPTCREIYREWRELGTSISAALIRAGEAAWEKTQDC